MTYQTGQVANVTNLNSLIRSFAIANGWTANDPYISKGLSNVNLFLADLSIPHTLEWDYTLMITGANSSAGLQPAMYARSIYIPPSSWPVTYHLQSWTNPDMIVCILNYDTDRIQVIFFGDMVKVHNSAFVGGNMFFASRGATHPLTSAGLYSLTDTVLNAGTHFGTQDTGIYNSPSSIPFASVNSQDTPGMGIHVEIDGTIWDGGYADNFSTDQCKVSLTDYTVSSLFRSPNAWNSQSHLIPMHLQFAMADSLFGYMGYVEHLRLIRVDNYNIGDIITLGTDKWKIYPWVKKSTIARNGTQLNSSDGYYHSGTVGLAVRYDGA